MSMARAWQLTDDSGPWPARQPTACDCCPYFDAYAVRCQPRELLFPGRAAERALAGGQAGNFPVLLVDGTVAGVWHLRRSGQPVTVTVEPLDAAAPRPAPCTRRPGGARRGDPRGERPADDRHRDRRGACLGSSRAGVRQRISAVPGGRDEHGAQPLHCLVRIKVPQRHGPVVRGGRQVLPSGENSSWPCWLLFPRTSAIRSPVPACQSRMTSLSVSVAVATVRPSRDQATRDSGTGCSPIVRTGLRPSTRSTGAFCPCASATKALSGLTAISVTGPPSRVRRSTRVSSGRR